VAEWARLLSECRGNSVAGSNPAFPATNKTHSIFGCVLFSVQVHKKTSCEIAWVLAQGYGVCLLVVFG
jgi:hypothetical protein